MQKTFLVLAIMCGAAAIFCLACTKKNHKASRHGDNKSHLSGSLCQSCHMSGGRAKDAFTVSGSIYNESRTGVQKKGIIKLYTKPKASGDLVATIETDEQGNFYSMQNIDFSKGLYPTLLGTPGVKEDTKHMNRRIFNGNCNGCHGLDQEPMGID